MPEPLLPSHLSSPVNASILRFLTPQSAHTDVAEALIKAIQPLGDVQQFCPNPSRCLFFCVSTLGTVFAFAVGQRTLGFRLDDRMKERALRSGASPLPDCGAEWVTFELFRDDWPEVDLRFWARKAYVCAREFTQVPPPV